MIEQKILAHLVSNDTYARKVLPFVKPEYFADHAHRVIYQTVVAYVERYNTIPSAEALTIDIDKIDGMSSDIFSKVVEIIPNLTADKDTDIEWLLDQTEKYCQDRAVYNAIMESITIIDGKSKDKGKGSIPQILSEALAVSFDTSVGHDFLTDSDARYEFYHHKEEKIEFDLEYFNKITRGGVPRKTLNVALAGTGVGKTLFMCHAAAANLSAGYKVLYITMEMSEERIAERIDSNLLNVTTDELKIMSKDVYDKKIDRVRNKCKGRLIIKEYPTSTAGSSNFRHLLQELKLKKKFVPDIIYIDYLNICSSSRMKMGNSVNSYMYIKAIAEELRGLAVEYNVPIFTATQTNRDGYNCLHEMSTVLKSNGDISLIKDLVIGDSIVGNNENRIVTNIWKSKKPTYKITLEDGREILCSAEHRFPTADNNLLSINSGLNTSMYLLVNSTIPIYNIDVTNTSL